MTPDNPENNPQDNPENNTQDNPENNPQPDILGIVHWRDFARGIITNLTPNQVYFYNQHTDDHDIINLVALDPKRFGTVCEQIISHIYNLGPRTSTQNDGTRNGKKIEIKTARYWVQTNDCKWQHLEPEHDYDCVLFALLDFHGWNVWCITKDVLMGECMNRGILTRQGEQGYMCNKNRILPYLTEIHNVHDLDNFLNLI